MEPVKLKTLYDLLAEGFTVAQLANAIETHGIHGWDRFGRYLTRAQPLKGEVVAEALDALADFYDYSIRFYDERETMSDIESPDLTSPIDSIDCFQTPLHRLGWLEDKLPQFCEMTAFPPPPKPKRARTQESPTLRVLGALMLCLEELKESGKTMRIPSEDVLIGMMEDRFPGVKWVAKTTIQYQFADSKATLRALKRPS